jgi:aryl-alcohol dehydrogenase-like predicted oxidoreductase
VRFDFEREELVQKMGAVDALQAVADDLGLTIHHLALAFALTNPAVAAVIVGPRTTAQLDQLLPAFDLRLPGDVMERLDAIVAPGVSLDAEDVLAYRSS